MNTEIEALTGEVREMRRSLDALLSALQPQDDATGSPDPVVSLTEILSELAGAVAAQADLIQTVASDVRAIRADMPGQSFSAAA